MKHYINLSDGQVRLWIDQESLHLKAIDPYGDPVEISVEDAVKLANALIEFAKAIDS